MIRRLLTTALCLGLTAGSVSVLPAHAEPPVTTISVLPAEGPNASELIAVANGQYLFADGSIYDEGGLVDVVDEVAGATVAEFTGNEVVLTRGVSGEEEVVLIDLVEDTLTIAEVPPGPRAAGVEGWVVEGVFHGWDGTSWSLPAMDGGVTGQAGGHLVFGAFNTLAVIEIATREVRELGPKGNSQQISNAGLGWRSPSQDCFWSWDEADPTCVSRTWGNEGGRLGRDTIVSMKYAEYPLPSRYTGHRVWVDGRWVAAPPPEDVRATHCGVPSIDAVCVGSSATGRAIHVIEPDGTWRTAVSLPAEPVEVLDMALTPTALYGTDSRGASALSTPAWVRTGAKLQTETRLQASGAVDASAGRGLIGRQWFDGAAPGAEAPNAAGGRNKVSGPYILNTSQRALLDMAGKNIHVASRSVVVDIFGTAQLRSTHLEDEDGVNYPVLADGRKLAGVWGPWVHGFEDGAGTFVKNWRTGAKAHFTKSVAASIWGIGDGILVTHAPRQGRISVFDITGLDKPLTPVFTFEGTPHSIERNRLAWTSPQGDVKISTFPFGGRTAPMMLGVTHDPIGRSTTKPWTPAFDFSAPLAQGQIVVKNHKDAVVHTIPTPATPSGSLRVSWDLRDAGGRALPNGAYTWELVATDTTGRPATRVNHLAKITGVLTIGPVISVAPPAPRYEVPCGETQPQMILPTVTGVGYSEQIDGSSRTVTAVAKPGFVLSGTSLWKFTTPTRGACTAPAPTFVDKPGSANDRLVIPSGPAHVSHYSVDGGPYPAGTHAVVPGETVVVRAHFQDPAAKPIEWRHTYSTAGGPVKPPTTPPAPKPQDPYSETGEYLINGRKWRTVCEPYSITRRCRTEIWATKTTQLKGRFVSTNGWVFNNLTYLASPRPTWKGNPLAETKSWTAADGREWRTECDTALTGRNGCRSFVEARVIEARAKAGGGYSYSWQTRWIFNNMVRFN